MPGRRLVGLSPENRPPWGPKLKAPPPPGGGEVKLPMADSLNACHRTGFGALLITQDSDFQGLPGCAGCQGRGLSLLRNSGTCCRGSVAGSPGTAFRLMAAPDAAGMSVSPCDASTIDHPKLTAGADPGEADPDETGPRRHSPDLPGCRRPRQRQVKARGEPNGTKRRRWIELPVGTTTPCGSGALRRCLRHYVSLRRPTPIPGAALRLGDFF